MYTGKMKTNLITLPSRANSDRVMWRLIPVLAFYVVIGLLAGCASGSTTTTTPQISVLAAGFECPTNTTVVTATPSLIAALLSPL